MIPPFICVFRQVKLFSKSNYCMLVNYECKFNRKFSRVSYSEFQAFNKNKMKYVGPMGWFLLTVPIATFGLGTWQVQRKKWKEDLINNIMTRTKTEPVDLPADDKEIATMEYRPVRVKGEFDHKNELYVGPRSCLIEGGSKTTSSLFSDKSSGTSGYLVVTPFILSDTHERILVNRGWIPFPKKKPETRASGQIKGETEIVGIVRLTEPHPPFTPKNKLDVHIWFSRNIEEIAQELNTRPVWIDAVASSTVPNGPIGGQTRASLRNEHLSYILTWYMLSISTAFMWYTRFGKRLQHAVRITKS